MTAPPDPSWLTQYPIVLPRYYDMAIIRDRVRRRGAALDGRPGLGFKAYAIRVADAAGSPVDDDADGSPVNEYAPFYSWTSAPAAADFLLRAAGFQGIVSDFGRPRVLTWLPVAEGRGPTPPADVATATRWTSRLPDGADPSAAAAALTEQIRALEGATGVHRAVGGIDPRTWEAVLFVTSDGTATTASVANGDRVEYEVLHVSEGRPR